MKKVLLAILILVITTGYSQKKKDGTIYNEHPAITTVEAMQQAFIAGDTARVSTYLAENFRVLNGSTKLDNQKGQDRDAFLNGVLFWKKNVDYLDIVRQNGAYPDAVEYKNSGTWVQTWEIVKGVHNKTGVKLEMPFHRLFLMNDEHKIQLMYNYYDERIFAEIGKSFQPRTNGKVYNNHENINTIRRLIYSFEYGDLDKAYSFFDAKARISNVHMEDGQSIDIDDDRKRVEEIFENFNFDDAVMVGYPDYIHYELNDSRVVQSWWNFKMTRKSDDKKIVLPIHFLHDFNDEGKIIRSMAYYSAKMLEE